MNFLFILYRRLRLLPLMVLVTAASLFLRVESATENAKLGFFISSPIVQAEEKEKKKEEGAEEKKKDNQEKEVKHEEKTDSHDKAQAADPLSIEADEQSMRPSAELKILEELATRRRELDAREAALLQKEALIKAGEKEFESKLTELSALRDEIKAMLEKANVQENEESARLIAIYEKMKPKEAATIFNTMDMRVLFPIVKGMKATKLSPILAKMDPAKARLITDALQQRSRVLPESTPERAAAAGAASVNALPALPEVPEQ